MQVSLEEMKFIHESPVVLRELAQYHETQITMAKAMDYDPKYHVERKAQLLEAARIADIVV